MKQLPVNATLLLLSFAVSACTLPAEQISLETLIARHSAARGGIHRIEAIETIQIGVDVIEPEFQVQGKYSATRDGLMRVDIFSVGVRVFTEALGPDSAWQMSADGTVTDVSTEGKLILERGVAGNLYGLHELVDLGVTLELLGTITRDGTDYWELTRTSPGGFSEHIYIDAESFLIASRMETSALHPDLDSTEVRQETFSSEYHSINGVQFPDKTEKRNLDTGEIMQTITVTSRVINEPIELDYFRRPSGN